MNLWTLDDDEYADWISDLYDREDALEGWD